MNLFNKYKVLTVAAGILLTSSCKNYLDVIPDNIPTVDHAFNNRHQAEGFLYGCYAFLPSFPNPATNPALLGGDEVWYLDPVAGINPQLWYIARGTQGTNAPLADYWASEQINYDLNGGIPFFTALRDCNIFLENIHKPFDLDDYEREQWIAEVKFLKAFYHFWLFRMYGPIPVLRENTPISAGSGETQHYREPVDSVVSYIVQLLDEAAEVLPLKIGAVTLDMGRPTKPVAMALKARVLLLAASPLFNGNSDYAQMVDNRGIQLFPQTSDPGKWHAAANAAKEAIDVAHEAGHALFDFRTTNFSANLSDETVLAMQVRGAATERWNSEIIWGDGNSNTTALQTACHPVFLANHNQGGIWRTYAPTMQVVEQFYTSNGVPIEEDIDWQGVDPLGVRTGDASHKYYIREGFETINLHFDRESRFYGAIAFDGGTYYGNGRTTSDNNMWVTQFKTGVAGGGNTPSDRYAVTGYLCKKLVHYLTSVPDNNAQISAYRYAFPIIRLADLYLMYAEALNESKDAPDATVYEYIDLVRARSGLKGVQESWTNHSINPGKPLSREGMRTIIQRERLNELAFEGSRFWDLKRWKLAEEYMNRPVRGLNIQGETTEDFYKERTLYQLHYTVKDYLWPIRQGVLQTNRNLIQNLGW